MNGMQLPNQQANDTSFDNLYYTLSDDNFETETDFIFADSQTIDVQTNTLSATFDADKSYKAYTQLKSTKKAVCQDLSHIISKN